MSQKLKLATVFSLVLAVPVQATETTEPELTEQNIIDVIIDLVIPGGTTQPPP